FFHEPGNAVAARRVSFFAQLLLDARSTIGLPAAGMNLGDLSGQRLIFQGPRARTNTSPLPIVKATSGNFQVKTERQNGMILFHRVDPFITFGDGSERMPSVFFKMVHCSRKWRTSRCEAPNPPCRSAADPGLAAVALPPATAGTSFLQA